MNSYEAFIDVFVSKVVHMQKMYALKHRSYQRLTKHTKCAWTPLYIWRLMNINEILQWQWMNILQKFLTTFLMLLNHTFISSSELETRGQSDRTWAMFWSDLLLQQNTVNDTKALISSERMTRFDQQRRHTSLWWICLLKCVIKSSIRNSHCPQGNHLQSDHAFNYIDVPAEAGSPAINMISYYQINAAFQTRCEAASARSMLTSLR